ncbi:MAG: hypothetical protein DKINENOH_03107 [bacterium]|nr:hypothetical protein [bacterium]
MDSLTFFDVYDYAVVAALILVAICFTAFSYRKIRREAHQDVFKARKSEILIGSLLLTVSIALFIYIEVSIDKAIGIMQPISIMTSEPFVLLSITLFLGPVKKQSIQF